jgi:hypothetical protein
LREFAPLLFQDQPVPPAVAQAAAETSGAAPAPAAGVSGQWRAEFDSPVGQQKYLFTFQVNEGKVTAKAAAELRDQKREVEFKEVKLDGNTLTFVEMRQFQDNEVRIDYTGKVSDNEIKFIRKVGDFGTTEFVARRVEAGAAAPSSPPNAGPATRPPRGRGGFGGPIVLGPDDKPAFSDAPAGFDVKREDIAHGNLEMIEYDSKTVGIKLRMQVYTPPGYSKDKKYCEFYCLHGIGDDETGWAVKGSAQIILDNLTADKKIEPMTAVPNNPFARRERRRGLRRLLEVAGKRGRGGARAAYAGLRKLDCQRDRAGCFPRGRFRPN